jgi:hypothetical protein
VDGAVLEFLRVYIVAARLVKDVVLVVDDVEHFSVHILGVRLRVLLARTEVGERNPLGEAQFLGADGFLDVEETAECRPIAEFVAEVFAQELSPLGEASFDQAGEGRAVAWGQFLRISRGKGDDGGIDLGLGRKNGWWQLARKLYIPAPSNEQRERAVRFRPRLAAQAFRQFFLQCKYQHAHRARILGECEQDLARDVVGKIAEHFYRPAREQGAQVEFDCVAVDDFKMWMLSAEVVSEPTVLFDDEAVR